jgi:geranylgeranyl diphosphate synthase, type II
MPLVSGTFTLIHDDIMDNAGERRGRPTVHVVWDANTAILAGDFLMGLSYDLLARTRTPDLAALVHTFHRMVAAVCEGQALDAAFERRAAVTVDDYLDMISRKTGALLVCVMELGARVAGADQQILALLTTAGRELGLAFQIQDDLLDLTAQDDGWGKSIGGDLVAGKKTFLLLQSLDRAEGQERAWFERIVSDGGLPAAAVPEARSRMEALGVLEDAARAVETHTRAAIEALSDLPAGEAQRALIWLTSRLAARGT